MRIEKGKKRGIIIILASPQGLPFSDGHSRETMAFQMPHVSVRS